MAGRETGGRGKREKKKGRVEKRKMAKKENLRGWGVVFVERRKRQRNWKTGRKRHQQRRWRKRSLR